MKVLFIGNVNSVYIRRWIEAYLKRNIDVSLITTFLPQSEYEVLGRIRTEQLIIDEFKKKYSFSEKAFYFKLAYKANSLFKDINPDIVHLHYVDEAGLGPVLKKGGFKLIANFWGSDFNYYDSRSKLNREILKFIYHYSDLLLTDCLTLQNDFKYKFPGYAHKIKTIFWGIDDIFFKKPKKELLEAIKKRFGLLDDDVVVLSTRGMVPNNNIDKIYEGACRVIGEFPEETRKRVKFIFHSGHYNYQQQYFYTSNLVRRMIDDKTENIIVNTELLTPEEIRALYHLAKINVCLCTHDAVSSSVIEGLAAGCVNILSDIKSYHDFHNYFEGLYVEYSALDQIDFSKVLHRLVNDYLTDREGLSGKLSNNMHIIRNKFSFEKSVDQMLGVYKEILVR